MTKDPNIDILKQNGFKKIILKEMAYSYEETYHTLRINFSLDTAPVSSKLIIDLKDIYNVFVNRLKACGVLTLKEYLSNYTMSTFYIYFIAKKSENKKYTIYFENGDYFSSLGYNNVKLDINYATYIPSNPTVVKQGETTDTIKKILNSVNIYKQEISYKLTNGSSDNEPLISSMGNEPFLQLKQSTEDKKDNKVYNYLLAYYLQHEKNNLNSDFFN